MTTSAVLFTPLGFNLAETTRMIEVARALPNGLDPVFVVHDETYLHLVRDAGFRLEPAGPPLTPEQRRQALAVDQERGLRLPFTEELLDARVRAERDAVRVTGAVAMVHGTNPTSTISARAEGIPLFYPVPLALTSPHLASGWTLPILPTSTASGRLLNPALTRLAAWAYASAPLVPAAFTRVAERHGAPPPRTFADLLGADVTLLTAMADEIGGLDLPASFHRVGPIFARLPGEVPPLVHRLAAGPEPLVYLACGSSGHRRLVLDVIDAVRTLPIQVVAPVRSYLTERDLADLPANVHVTDLLPAHRLGGLVDAAILHGGQGTVQTACAGAIPFVGIGLQTEQRWNVGVCERRGHAISVAPRQVRGRGLRVALHRVLTDPTVRRVATEVAAEYRDEDGAARSAAVIADLVG
ncbi:glycosyltransferase [Mobilicoccus caccae]|uniref:Glycosyl transferase n=1 Tax=Mobilicoccus caccae TaxID=1859295 RepID=A0ABQ6IVM9_9MICO|nr:nucleotide disphospho-sugar-binding domain-containing protein [Mobilicoccus caccae]GMA40743.1 glycosyl transferase [Mobilicoccus caccae]